MIAFQHLAWDSAFFSLRIARVEGHRLVEGDPAAIDAWCRTERIDCLYFLAEDEPGTVALAGAAGFRQVDLRVTLEADPLPDAGPPSVLTVRPARPDEVSSLEDIAAGAHRDTRFFRDGRFPAERCVELYRTWIRNSCRGWADAVLVSEDAGGPAGYVTAHRRPGGRGEIGLLGVAARVRGQGHGQALVGRVLGSFREAGLTRARVVTQGANGPALGLYRRAGFSVLRSELWYHRWAPA